MAKGPINEYVHDLLELYALISEVATGLYRVQGCLSGYRNVAPEDALSPANIKSRADVPPPQMIGLRKELEFSIVKKEAIQEQLRSAELHIKVENDEQRRRIQELEFVVGA